MARFQTKIQKARFVVSGLTSNQMAGLGNHFVTDMTQRIRSGINVQDAPAKPLSKRYEKFKAKKYPPAIRNMALTGRTLRSTKVLTASENRAVVGLTDAETNKRAHICNSFDRQWGASPKDIEGFVQAVRDVRLISAEKVA